MGLCFPLLLALVYACVRVVGCNGETELLLVGTGVDKAWKRI